MNCTVNNNQATIELTLIETIFSLRRQISFDRTNITATKNSRPRTHIFELRVPGSYFPWLIKAGTYYTKRGKEFWYTTYQHKHFLTIQLENENYKQIILGFTDQPQRDQLKQKLPQLKN